MKKSLILLSCFFSLFIHADKQYEDYLRAQQLVQDNHYDQALRIYETIINPGYTVLYNKGVCYYHLKEYIKAFTAFKKALYLSSRSTYDTTLQALYKTASQMSINYHASLKDRMYKFDLYFPMVAFQLLFLLCASLSLWFMLYRNSSYTHLLLIFLSCGLGGYNLFAWNVFTAIQAVVIAPTEIRAGPSNDYQSIDTFSPLTVVTVDKKEKSWYKVKGAQKAGWVQDTTVHLIEENL